jgi:hypothetical protein
MLNLQAKATAATEEPDGRSVSDLVLDGRRWRCVAGTSGHRGPFRQETASWCLLVLFEGCRQVYSPYETQVDGLPIWGMSAKL